VAAFLPQGCRSGRAREVLFATIAGDDGSGCGGRADVGRTEPVPERNPVRVSASEVGSAAAAQDQSPQRRALGIAVKVVFGLAVLAFGVVFVASRWSRLSDALAQARIAWIVAAVVFAVCGQWASALGFRWVLAATARVLPVSTVGRLFFVSQLGKYIPGSVWPIVAVTEMCRRHGISRRAAAVAGVLSLVFSLVAGGMVGIVLVLAGASGSATGLWWLVLLVPVGFAAVHPRVVDAAVNVILRLSRREPIQLQLVGPALRGSLGWPVVSWVLMGLQCWALVAALGGPLLSTLAASIGGFALAYTAGTLFVPAPAGAGVREAVLGVALSSVIHGGSFDSNKVIVVVLLSRVLLAVLDFAQAGVIVLTTRGAQINRAE
jgi:glycosyltransferase 2 family protein